MQEDAAHIETQASLRLRSRRSQRNPMAVMKSRAVRICVPRNGCSVRRSRSPVTRYSARPLTASSRNLSSLGSRHLRTDSRSLIHSADSTNADCSQMCHDDSLNIIMRYILWRQFLPAKHEIILLRCLISTDFSELSGRCFHPHFLAGLA